MPDERYRILCYCQDTPTSGQTSRAVTLAAHVLRTYPNAEALLLTRNLATCDVRELPARCEVVKLPTRTRRGTDRQGNPRQVLADEPPRYVRMRGAILRDIAREYQPHLMFVDNEPLGVQGELTAALGELSHQRHKPSIVFGLRDIRGAAAHVRPRWAAGGIYTALERYYHRILVYGEQDIYDVAAEYGLSPTLASRVRYCGYMSQPATQASGTSVRKELGLPDDMPLIAVLGDSGTDGHTLRRAYLDALPRISEQTRAHSVLVTGTAHTDPDCEVHDEVVTSGLPVSVLATTDPTALLAEAQVVICRGGYTSVVSALAQGHHPLVIPRETRSGEQRLRANLFAERGWCALIREHDVEPERLAREVVSLLERGPSRPPDAFDPEQVGDRVAEAVRPLLAHTTAEAQSAAPAAPMAPAASAASVAPMVSVP